MVTPLLAGLGLGFSLIVAIGAQNLFVLRQGIRREHVVAVASVCALSDGILIALGIFGIGAALHELPWFSEIMRWAGAAFLLGYALRAAYRATRPGGGALNTDGDPSGSPQRATRATLASCILTCLALTWLNPRVYLDTVFLLGSVRNAQGEGRGWFGIGAALASILWFFGLGFGARLLSPPFSSLLAWRILDAGIAVVMCAIALSLLLNR